MDWRGCRVIWVKEIQAGVYRTAQRNRFPARGRQRRSPAVNFKTEPVSQVTGVVTSEAAMGIPDRRTAKGKAER